MRITVIFAAVLVMVLSFSFTGVLPAAESTGSVSMTASPSPQPIQIEGKGLVTIDPGLYPVFTSIVPTTDSRFPESRSPACLNNVKNKSGQLIKPNVAGNYLSIPGWTQTTVTVPANSTQNAKFLITWTLRVEAAASQSAVAVDSSLDSACPASWYGVATEKLVGGQVYARLFINGKAVGDLGAMTVPDFTAPLTYQKDVPPPPPPPAPVYSHDPTISGSFQIDKSFFGGTFPAKFSVEVKWFNATGQKMYSDDLQRVIIIESMPGE